MTLSVSDNTDTAYFLGFDIAMTKLTNILASEALQIVGICVDARVDTEFPQALAELVWKTYTFQLKLNDFNFTSKHQTVTISHIFPERALAPLPDFVESGNNPDAAVAEAVAPATPARVGTTGNDTGEPYAPDATLSKLSTSTTGEVASGGNEEKKARVE
ncbi:hypothetical protein YC2023_094250 [Brassica napus]